MVVEEQKRRRLQEALMNTIGTDETDTLFDDFLPRGGWANVATTQDLQALESHLDGRIDRLEGRIGGLDGRIDGLDGRIDGLDGKIDGLEGRIDAKIDALRAEMHEALRQQLYTFVMLVVGLAGLFVALAGLVFGLQATHVIG
ncbi:MAG TPA: hypothetical protein VFJ19_20715 [Nocardioidaceae bacterium]|nr:hypothetical protein [Nocardioidaceae bacterium]